MPQAHGTPSEPKMRLKHFHLSHLSQPLLSLLKNELRLIGWGQAERAASQISCGSPLIGMMPTAPLREGNNIARRGKLYGTRPRAVFVEREMRSGVVVILKIARQY